MGTEGRLTDSEARPVAIHSPIDRRLPANNSLDRIVAVSIVAIGIGAPEGIGAEALLENEHQVEIQIARVIGPAVRPREIVAMQIELEVAM